jgi:hypothetical protein
MHRLVAGEVGGIDSILGEEQNWAYAVTFSFDPWIAVISTDEISQQPRKSGGALIAILMKPDVILLISSPDFQHGGPPDIKMYYGKTQGDASEPGMSAVTEARFGGGAASSGSMIAIHWCFHAYY